MQNINLIMGNALSQTLTQWTETVKGVFSSLGTFGDVLLVLLILWIGKIIVKAVGKLLE